MASAAGLARDRRHVDLDLRTQPVVRWQVVVAVGTMLLGLVLSYAGGTAFDPRYAAVSVPILVVISAVGLNVFASKSVRMGALVVVLLLARAREPRLSDTFADFTRSAQGPVDALEDAPST